MEGVEGRGEGDLPSRNLKKVVSTLNILEVGKFQEECMTFSQHEDNVDIRFVVQRCKTTNSAIPLRYAAKCDNLQQYIPRLQS